MQLENSKAFELDLRNIKDISISIILGILTIYASNTEIINSILSKYIPDDVFAIIVMILAYAGKKYVSDYSNNIK